MTTSYHKCCTILWGAEHKHHSVADAVRGCANGLAGAELAKADSHSARKARGSASNSTASTHAHTPAIIFLLASHVYAATRHPSTADAAHRHVRAGLRERNVPKPTRGARAKRPATSQHRAGRQRRGSDERRRTKNKKPQAGYLRRQRSVLSGPT